MKNAAYVLFLLTGIFCLYVIMLFVRGGSSSVATQTVDVSDVGSTEFRSLEERVLDIQPTIDIVDDIGEPDDTSTLQELSEAFSRFQRKLDSEDVPLHSDIYTRLTQAYSIEPVDVRDIFGFYIFGNLHFSAYSTGTARMYAFEDPFYIIERNLKLLESYFTFNETNTFFGSSFFLNSISDDGIVRFVFEFENDAYGVEILASEYEAFKKALLGL